MTANDRCIAMGADGECHQYPAATTGSTDKAGDVNLSASVGNNAYNRFEDVRTVQDALNSVPATDGGPDPLLKVDGLCYGKSVAAIRKFQKLGCGFQWPDGKIDPERRTHLKLRTYFIPANPYITPLVYSQLGEAMSWTFAALRVVDSSLWYVQKRPGGLASNYALVNKYFHLDKFFVTSQRVQSLVRIRSIFTNMQLCIGRQSAATSPGSGYFQEDLKENRHLAYTYYGGFTRAMTKGKPPLSKPEYSGPVNRQDAIYLCPRKIGSRSTLVLTYIIVHELAHFVGPEIEKPDRIDDHSYRKKGDEFFRLAPELALRTADCYSQFAAEAKLGHEAPPYWA